MTYGVTFILGNIAKHSFKDFHILMLNPKISHPAVKSKTIDIPGADGTIDLMPYISSIEKYNNRQIEIPFFINASTYNWENKVTEVSNFLNGRNVKVIFDDKPDYYFYGKATVIGLSQTEVTGTFSVTIDAQPYKLAVQTVDEAYLWDTFNLENGIIYSEYICGDYENENRLKNIDVSGNTAVTVSCEVQRMPVEPIITVKDDDLLLGYNGEIFNLKGSTNGYQNIPAGLVLTQGRHSLVFYSEDSSFVYSQVSISYRNGVF